MQGRLTLEAPQFGLSDEVKYPLLLPFTRGVPLLNDLMSDFLTRNLEYWQFLIADKADFPMVYVSCDRLLLRLSQLLEHYFWQSQLSLLQRAQFCTNIEHSLKSFQGFFKRQIYQTVNYGAYNL